MSAGYVCLEPAEGGKVAASQRNLLDKRGAIWGRIAVLRLFGLPAPRLMGFSLFKQWRRLSLEGKMRSTLGTARRILTRKLFRPLKLDATEASH